jgi:AraC-like DNA-binding protein
MTPEAEFLSSERQALIDAYEQVDRSAVGFSMDYASGLCSGMHRHPKAQLIYAISGVMRVETKSAYFVLPPTKALFLPPDELHSISMEGDVAMRQLLIDCRLADHVASEARVLTVNPLLRELLVAICNEPVAWDETGRAPHIVALILDELGRAKTLFTRLPSIHEPRLLRVAQTIIENPADARSLEDWAEICGASDRTLARLFLRETGMTFGQWRLQARLNAAFILLMTEGDISRVAQKVGFSSHSAFGVAFRRTFGLTPAQARTLHLG